MGSPIHRSCADGLWWDIRNEWCTSENEVTCDDRTSNNPRPPTTTESLPTVPTQPPSLSNCYAIRHLFDQESGTYLKSFCTLNTHSTYELSESLCRDNNMELFVIDNSAVQEAFFGATTESLEAYPQGLVWINGRRESSGDWFTSSPQRQPLYSGIDWVQTETIIGQDNGDCLAYTRIHGPYKAMGHDCMQSHWLTCQYSDEHHRVNTDICSFEIPLILDDGEYLKTTCIVNTLHTYESGERLCYENGMNLFVINNSTVQAALFTAVTDTLSVSQPRGFLWINGVRDAATSEWFTFSPERRELYDGIDWVQTEEVDGPTNGDCLRFSSQHGPYQAKGDDCSAVLSWIICEYWENIYVQKFWILNKQIYAKCAKYWKMSSL